MERCAHLQHDGAFGAALPGELCGSFAQPADRVVTTSAEQGLGVSELWRALAGFLGEASP